MTRLRHIILFIICLTIGYANPAPAAETGNGQILSLGNGIVMELLQENGRFLGIGEIRSGKRLLHGESHPVFPLVAADWSYPSGLYTDLRLREVRKDGTAYELVIDVRESDGSDAWRSFFVFDEGESIARDDFSFARTALRLPEGVEGHLLPESVHMTRMEDHPPSGHLVWRIEPVTEVIAGWKWHGWRWSFSGRLENGAMLNAFRLLSAWALDGHMDGLTLVNQRYRGLGYPAQTFSDEGEGVRQSWNTQDVRPDQKWKGRSADLPREEAIRLRNTCTLHAPARGAGTGFIDYQYRKDAALLGFPERQGNLRALTEVYPGDRLPMQLDEEHFASTAQWQTTPHRYLVLTAEAPQPDHFWQTRYLEGEQRVRAAVASELGFRETPVVPTVGALFDFWRAGDGFAQVVARLGAHAGRWAELGVRRIMVHNPGWLNGRAARNGWDGADPESFVGGSVNTVYDWWPLPEVESAWRHTHAALRELGIDYYIWISGMTHRDAGFHELVGKDPAAWASNHPDGSPSPIYGESTLKHNILSKPFRDAFDGRLDAVRREFGFEGFWGDSFHNLFMSQMDWRGFDGKPQQRAWWEWLSERSRDGLGWISESHSFPGQSCSIETDGWEQHPWLMGHTTKWLRGYAQWDRTPQRWMPLAYRLMAFNAWLAPETWLYEVTRETQPDSVIADFGRLANEFLAAQPEMARPYILPGDKGVLWLSDSGDNRAVLFPFERMSFPDGVSGIGVIDTFNREVAWTRAWETMAVHGDNLLEGFGIEPPPEKDLRSRLPEVKPTVGANGEHLPSHPETYTFTPVPGKVESSAWNGSSQIWRGPSDEAPVAWPANGERRAYFPAARRLTLPVEGRVKALAMQTVTPGVSLLIDTVQDTGPGSALELYGPLLGPATVYFKGTLREGGWPHTPMRSEVGLQFRGGGVYDLEADLLPWPEDRNHHSQVVGLMDRGTTVHFRGAWDAKGELCRPGLVLGDGTRFVIWPEADLSFIKDYGGFTLQLWVTGTGEEGGILELHPEFVADRSRFKLSSQHPHAEDIVPEGIGSIRIAGATLLTHNSRNLPMTARATGRRETPIQNNGHLVFEDRGNNRWIVRTRDQVYRGAVWVDHDLELVTEKTLTLSGITEAPDAAFSYTAANAFQTRHKRHSPERITIRKRGQASLVLKGEQAYVPGSVLEIMEGSVELHTDPAAGGGFPHGAPMDSPNLEIKVMGSGTLSVHADEMNVRSIEVAPEGQIRWAVAGRAVSETPVSIAGSLLYAGPALAQPAVLLVAPEIILPSKGLPDTMRIRQSEGGMELVILPE